MPEGDNKLKSLKELTGLPGSVFGEQPEQVDLADPRSYGGLALEPATKKVAPLPPTTKDVIRSFGDKINPTPAPQLPKEYYTAEARKEENRQVFRQQVNAALKYQSELEQQAREYYGTMPVTDAEVRSYMKFLHQDNMQLRDEQEEKAQAQFMKEYGDARSRNAIFGVPQFQKQIEETRLLKPQEGNWFTGKQWSDADWERLQKRNSNAASAQPVDMDEALDANNNIRPEFARQLLEAAGGSQKKARELFAEYMEGKRHEWARPDNPTIGQAKEQERMDELHSNILTRPLYYGARFEQGVKGGLHDIGNLLVNVVGGGYREAFSGGQFNAANAYVKAQENWNKISPATTATTESQNWYNLDHIISGGAHMTGEFLPSLATGGGNMFDAIELKLLLAGGARNGVLGAAYKWGAGAAKSTGDSFIGRLMQNTLHMTKTAFPQVYSGYVEDGMAKGYTPDQAMARALKRTPVNLIAMSFPGAVARGTTAMRAVPGKILSSAEPQTFMRQMMGTAGKFVKAPVTGAAAFAAGSLVDSYQNFLEDKREGRIDPDASFDYEHALKDAAEQASFGMIWGVMEKAVHGHGVLPNPAQADYLFQATTDMPKFMQALDRNVKRGKMSEQQAMAMSEFVQRLEPVIKEARANHADPRTAVLFAVEGERLKETAKAMSEMNNKIQITETVDAKGKKVPLPLGLDPKTGTYTAERGKELSAQVEALQTKAAQSARAIQQLREGTYLQGRTVSGTEMMRIAGKYSPGDGLRTGQAKDIVDNGPYRTETMRLSRFGNDAEMQMLVADLKDFKPQNTNPPVLDAAGNIIDGKKRIAYAIANGATEIEVARPVGLKEVSELVADELQQEPSAERATEGLNPEQLSILNDAGKAFDLELQRKRKPNNAEKAAGVTTKEGRAYYAAAIELLDKGLSKEETIDMLRRVGGGNISEPLAEAFVNNIAQLQEAGKPLPVVPNAPEKKKAKASTKEEADPVMEQSPYWNPETGEFRAGYGPGEAGFEEAQAWLDKVQSGEIPVEGAILAPDGSTDNSSAGEQPGAVPADAPESTAGASHQPTRQFGRVSVLASKSIVEESGWSENGKAGIKVLHAQLREMFGREWGLTITDNETSAAHWDKKGVDFGDESLAPNAWVDRDTKTIYLNVEKAAPSSTLDEIGHVWTAWTKMHAPEIHAKGRELAEQSEEFRYMDQLAAGENPVAPEGMSEAEADLWQRYVDAYGPRVDGRDILIDEVITHAIQKQGKLIAGAPDKSRSVDDKGKIRKGSWGAWLDSLWTAIKNAANHPGFRKMTVRTFSKITLEAYAKAAAEEIASGKRLTRKIREDVDADVKKEKLTREQKKAAAVDESIAEQVETGGKKAKATINEDGESSSIESSGAGKEPSAIGGMQATDIRDLVENKNKALFDDLLEAVKGTSHYERLGNDIPEDRKPEAALLDIIADPGLLHTDADIAAMGGFTKTGNRSSAKISGKIGELYEAVAEIVGTDATTIARNMSEADRKRRKELELPDWETVGRGGKLVAKPKPEVPDAEKGEALVTEVKSKFPSAKLRVTRDKDGVTISFKKDFFKQGQGAGDKYEPHFFPDLKVDPDFYQQKDRRTGKTNYESGRDELLEGLEKRREKTADEVVADAAASRPKPTTKLSAKSQKKLTELNDLFSLPEQKGPKVVVNVVDMKAEREKYEQQDPELERKRQTAAIGFVESSVEDGLYRLSDMLKDVHAMLGDKLDTLFPYLKRAYLAIHSDVSDDILALMDDTKTVRNFDYKEFKSNLNATEQSGNGGQSEVTPGAVRSVQSGRQETGIAQRGNTDRNRSGRSNTAGSNKGGQAQDLPTAPGKLREPAGTEEEDGQIQRPSSGGDAERADGVRGEGSDLAGTVPGVRDKVTPEPPEVIHLGKSNKKHTLVGRNAFRDLLYEDENGIRAKSTDGRIFVFESVSMIPTERGIEARLESRDSDYKTVEELKGDGPAAPIVVEQVEEKERPVSATPQPRNFTFDPAYNGEATFNRNQRFKDNIAALEILHTLDTERRMATPAEQAALAKYVGWGGLKQIILDPSNDSNWQVKSDQQFREHVRNARELIDRLDPDGSLGFLEAAKFSINNAHYTSLPVIRGIYDALKKTGFNGGKVLEPSAGIGNFMAAMPGDMAGHSKWTAVELDPMTGKILAHLQQKADVYIKGFQDAGIPPNSHDLVISNVPFGDFSVHDPSFKSKDKRYNQAAQSIHNYFFVKAVDTARPGGLVAFVTSRYTMDSSKNKAVRELINENAEFLGAIRLPGTAFIDNAGTEVVTDIIFLRKYNEGEAAKKDDGFINVGKTTLEQDGKTHDLTYSSYFQKHPEQMLGRVEAGGLYSADEFFLAGDRKDDMQAKIAEAAGRIFTDPFYSEAQVNHNTNLKASATQSVSTGEFERFGNLVELPDGVIGKVMPDHFIDAQLDAMAEAAGVDPNRIRQNRTDYGDEQRMEAAGLKHADFQRHAVEPLRLGKERKEIISKTIGLRRIVNRLLDAELNDGNEALVTALRDELKDKYEAFVKKHGRLLDKENKKAILDPSTQDSDAFTVLSLEKVVDGKIIPSDVLSKRTVKPLRKITEVNSVPEGILASYQEFGTVNLPHIAKLLGKTEDVIMAEQRELESPFLFEQPDGTIVSREEYLSGNVRKKLLEARVSAEADHKFAGNVRELEKIQPEDVMAGEIHAPLGAEWIPIPYMRQFINDHVGVDVQIRYDRVNKQWSITEGGKSTPQSESYKTARKGFGWLLKRAMDGTSPKVTYVVEEGMSKKTVVDEADTALAKENINRLLREWDNWKYNDDERRVNMQRIYNDTYNNTVLRNYDGSHMYLPGIMNYELRPHQKDVVWRMLQTGGGIMDHQVGSGKTLAMAAIAMEGRRTELFKKPAFIGLKAQVAQGYEEFKRAYPTANILYPSAKDFTASNRKQLLQRIATNDWDVVMLTHDQFNMLRQDEDIQADIMREILTELNEQEMAETDKRRKQGLQKRIANYENRIEKLLDAKKDADVRGFHELGIDFLMADESQEYKNLEFTTKHNEVRGLGNALGSKRAFNMLIATRTLQRMNGGDKGVLFASGTPISNSISEMYTLFRYLRPNLLQEQGINSLDSWLKVFAEHDSDLEYYMGKFKEVTRLRKFVNLPELITQYRNMSDVRNKYNLDLPKPKATHHLVKVQPSDGQMGVMKKLQAFIESKGNDFADELGLTAGYDDVKGMNPAYAALASTFAKKLSMDTRLINRSYGEGAKIKSASDKIAAIYHETNEDRGVQLVFSDVGTPKGKNAVGNLYDYLENLGTFSQADMTEIFGEDFENKTSKPAMADVQKRMAETLEMTQEDVLDIVRESASEEVFDVYNEMKRQLVAQGVPAEQIEFIHSHEGDVKRKALYSRVNAGEVRILLGSTKKLGVGVNVQERAVAAHHLDIAWKPSDMEQRNGRVERQGNELAKKRGNNVDIYYYATERLMDASMYELVQSKDNFIQQVKLGGTTARSTEDITGEIDMGSMAAELSGDPLFKEISVLKKKYRELELADLAWRNNQFRIKDKINNSEKILDIARESLPRAEEAAKHFASLPKEEIKDKDGKVTGHEDHPAFVGVVDGKTYDKPGKLGEALLADIAKRPVRFSGSYIAAKVYGDFVVRVQSVNGEIKAMVEAPNGLKLSAEFTLAKDPVSAGTQIKTSVVRVANKVQEFTDMIERNEKNLAEYRSQQSPKFERAEDLEATRTELAAKELQVRENLKRDAEAKRQEQNPDMPPEGGGDLYNLPAREEGDVTIKTDHATMEGHYGDTLEGPEGKIKLPGKGLYISDVVLNKEADKGQGYGQEIYKKALAQNGTLYSSWPTSDDALRVQDKLVEKGYATVELKEIGDELFRIIRPTEKLQAEAMVPLAQESLDNRRGDSVKFQEIMDSLEEQGEQNPDALAARGDLFSFPLLKSKRASLIIDAHKEYFTKEDEWLGNKDIATFHAQNMARRFQTEIQESVGPKPNAVLHPIDRGRWKEQWRNVDRAIHIYLDTERNPDHLQDYAQALAAAKLTLRNPSASADEVTKAKNIVAQEKTVEMSQNLTTRQMDIAKAIDAEYRKIGQLAKDNEIIRDTIDNYVARAWDFGPSSTEINRKFATYTRHSMQRALETILEGFTRGYKLKIEGATNNLATLHKEISNVIENRRLLEEGLKLKDENGVPLFAIHPPEGYVRIESPQFRKWKYEGKLSDYTADERRIFGNDTMIDAKGNVLRKRDVYAPAEIATSLNNILGKTKLDGKFVQGLTKFNAAVKQSILSYSGFHFIAFTREHVLATGSLTKLPVNPISAYKTGLNLIAAEHPLLQTAIKNGLTISRMQDFTEGVTLHNTWLNEKMDGLGGFSATAKNKLLEMNHQFHRYLFENYGAGLKAFDTIALMKQEMARNPGEDINQIAKRVAKNMNDSYGGLNWDRMRGSSLQNPTVRHLSSLLLLAPDWTIANLRYFRSAFARGEEGLMYRKAWGRVILRGIALTTLANAAMAAWDDEDDDGNKLDWVDAMARRYKKGWDAGRLRWLMVDITPMYHAMGGDLNKRSYFSVFGAYADPLKMMGAHKSKDGQWELGITEFLQHKGAVVTKMFGESLTGENWQHKQFTTIDELLGIDDKGVYKYDQREHHRGEINPRTGKPFVRSVEAHAAGGAKGGKNAGHLTRTVDFGGGVSVWKRPAELPSFVLSQMRGMLPTSLQSLMAASTGENDWAQFALQAPGSGIVTSKDPDAK